MGQLKRYAIRVEERRALLADEIERFVNVCRAKADVRAVYVFGSYASGRIGPTSDLDLLVVRDTHLAYNDRGDDLRREASLEVHLDLIVVTPVEYRDRLPTTGFGNDILAGARCLYAA